MKDIKAHINVIILASVVILSLAGYFWAIRQDFFEVFVAWAQQNFVLYFGVLVLIKIVGIVWPPLPGGILTLGSVPVIGWLNAFAADIIGGTIGASIAYFLGKKYGQKILNKFFDKPIVDRVNKIKVSKSHEMEAVFMLRLFMSSISEVISYGAGILGIKYRNFITGTILAYFFIVPIFYIAGSVLAPDGSLINRGTAFNAVIILTMGFLVYKLRGRYFE